MYKLGSLTGLSHQSRHNLKTDPSHARETTGHSHLWEEVLKRSWATQLTICHSCPKSDMNWTNHWLN